MLSLGPDLLLCISGAYRTLCIIWGLCFLGFIEGRCIKWHLTASLLLAGKFHFLLVGSEVTLSVLSVSEGLSRPIWSSLIHMHHHRDKAVIQTHTKYIHTQKSNPLCPCFISRLVFFFYSKSLVNADRRLQTGVCDPQ